MMPPWITPALLLTACGPEVVTTPRDVLHDRTWYGQHFHCNSSGVVTRSRAQAPAPVARSVDRAPYEMVKTTVGGSHENVQICAEVDVGSNQDGTYCFQDGCMTHDLDEDEYTACVDGHRTGVTSTRRETGDGDGAIRLFAPPGGDGRHDPFVLTLGLGWDDGACLQFSGMAWTPLRFDP